MLIDKRIEKKYPEKHEKVESEPRTKPEAFSAVTGVCTLAVAAVFGYIGRTSGLPGGTFLFAIIAVVILKIRFDFAYLPPWFRRLAQVINGCYIGGTITLESLRQLKYAFIPAGLIVLGYLVNCLVTGYIVYKTTTLTRREAMLTATPAGAADMALMFSDMGINNTDIIVIQIFRVIAVLSVFLQLINCIVRAVV